MSGGRPGGRLVRHVGSSRTWPGGWRRAPGRMACRPVDRVTGTRIPEAGSSGSLYRSLGRVAELADAQDSGSCVRKDVGVQVPPRPPKGYRDKWAGRTHRTPWPKRLGRMRGLKRVGLAPQSPSFAPLASSGSDFSVSEAISLACARQSGQTIWRQSSTRRASVGSFGGRPGTARVRPRRARVQGVSRILQTR